jgi:hypothetical protein
MNPEHAGEESNPYLSLYFALQSTTPPTKKGRDPAEERKDSYELPSSHEPPDGRQASLVFYKGLDLFHFLSQGVKNALKELINIRADLVLRHGKSTLGQQYAQDFLLRAEARRLS